MEAHKPSPDSVKSAVAAAQYQSLRRNLYAYIAVACLIALAALFYALWAKYNYERATSAYSITKTDLDSVSRLAVHYLNKDSLLIVENISLKAQNEGAIKDLSDDVFNLQDKQQKLIKSVNYYAQLKQQVDVRLVRVPFDSGQKIPLIAAGRSDSIAVPVRFSVADSTKSIAGHVTRYGVDIDSLLISNELFLRNVTIKKGFLNLGREDRVQAINTSKYLVNSTLADMRYKPKPSAWNRWIKPVGAFLIGAGGMYYLTK